MYKKIIIKLSTKDILRFQKYFTKLSPNQCWLWKGKLCNGYGSFTYIYNGEKKRVTAHRVAYYLHHKFLPLGTQICHSCANSHCVNPHHLFISSKNVNLKRRGKKSKFTRKEISHIQQLWQTKTLGEIAKKYHISKPHVLYLVHKKVRAQDE